MSEERVIATYHLESPLDLHKAAHALAKEQSTGTWVSVGAETEEVMRRHGAEVLEVEVSETDIPSPSLPTRLDHPGPHNAGKITVAFPCINFGPFLSNLLSAVAGNLYEMADFTAIKLLDLEFTESYLEKFPGPRFGIHGTREAIGVQGRPIVGAIIKPCVGLGPQELASLAYEGAKGGLDFIKDDELLADTEYNGVEERVKAVMAALRRAYEETGEGTMYAFNITTDGSEKVKALHDIVVENGGNCVMLNFATAGFGVLRALAEYTQLPIHAHRDFFPSFTRSPSLGMSTRAFTKLARLAGADQLHIGAIAGKLYETDEETLDNVRTCLEPFGPIGQSLPVNSGGQWAGKIPRNLRLIDTVDFLHLSGGGVFGHPDGPAAGASSIRQAVDATLQGIPIEEHARGHKELARALEHFGPVLY